MENDTDADAPTPYRVLIVEDESIVAYDIQQTLMDLGYDPYAVASSAWEALAQAAEKRPDVVLMDIRIKGDIDGIATAKILQERFSVPIVYLTSHADDATIARTRTTEPTGFLMKPVRAGELRSAVELAIHKHRMNQEMRKSTDQLLAVLENIGDGVVVADADGRFTHFNPAARRILGRGPTDSPPSEWAREFGTFRLDGVTPFPADEVPLALAIRGIATDNVDLVIRSALREDPVFLTVTGTPIKDDNGVTTGGVVILHDITERKRILEQIQFTALHDDLTGLANRAMFVEALQQAIQRAERHGEKFAVLCLDLDRFKDVNDALGHPVGDLLLKSVAERLRSSVRGMDTVSRFGGDEFAVIETSITEPLHAAVLAAKLLRAISHPFSVKDNELRTGASIGIAVYGPDSPNAETLLAHADVALYRAKAEGRGTYRFFTKAMDADVRTRVTMAAELRDAIANGELFLMYQPQIDADTGRIVGVEALARWQHPRSGLIPPGVFIPLAEQNGLIIALGNWVLREACGQMKRWIDAGIAPPLMAVNVSGHQFKTPLAFESEITDILAEAALLPEHLELELTESALMAVSSAHNEALLRLRKAGHRIAIDDFGTGYSSLEYLGRFPVDRIKIAQCFMTDLNTTGNTVIVRAALGLGRELKIDVVVEGVETAEQLRLVRSWGSRKVQGFYFSRPLTACDLEPLLRAGIILSQRSEVTASSAQ